MSVFIDGVKHTGAQVIRSLGVDLFDGAPAGLVVDIDPDLGYHQVFLHDGATNHEGLLYYYDGTFTLTSDVMLTSLGYRVNQPALARGEGAVTGRGLVAGRNSSGDGAAGYLLLEGKDGTDYYLWVDATGDLRIHTAPPTEDASVSDTAGTVVGSQS